MVILYLLRIIFLFFNIGFWEIICWAFFGDRVSICYLYAMSIKSQNRLIPVPAPKNISYPTGI